MKEENKETIFEKSVEGIAWIQIFLSPVIVGAVISAVIYFYNPNNLTMIIAIVIMAITVFIGAKLASSIKKDTGTVNFLSNTSSTKDLDETINKDKK